MLGTISRSLQFSNISVTGACVWDIAEVIFTGSYNPRDSRRRGESGGIRMALGSTSQFAQPLKSLKVVVALIGWRNFRGHADVAFVRSCACARARSLRANERTISCSWLRFKAVSWPSRAVAIEGPQPINPNPRHPFCNSREPRWESEIRVSALTRSKETDNGRGARNDFLLSRGSNQFATCKANSREASCPLITWALY